MRSDCFYWRLINSSIGIQTLSEKSSSARRDALDRAASSLICEIQKEASPPHTIRAGTERARMSVPNTLSARL